MPTISVLMPVYNVAPYLKKAIDSILDQTFSDFEFLIMDDGSTDDSLSIALEAAELDSRIRVFERPNRKVAACLNEMVSLAQGEFIARMDGDDIARPARLQKQLDYLINNPETAVVGSWVRTFGSREEVWHFRQWDNFSRNLLIFGVTILSHPTWMLQKSMLTKHPYDDNYRSIIDREWLARVAFHEPELSFVALPEVLLDYRIHETSVTGLFADVQVEKTRRMIADQLSMYELILTEQQLKCFTAVCLGGGLSHEEACIAGDVVEYIRERIGTSLSDDFAVFREKWINFCINNGHLDLVNRFVPQPDFVFFSERRVHSMFDSVAAAKG